MKASEKEENKKAKQKAREAMEVRQSARQISIKRFYKENSSSEEEKKKGNLGLLCHMKGSIKSFYRTHSLKT